MLRTLISPKYLTEILALPSFASLAVEDLQLLLTVCKLVYVKAGQVIKHPVSNGLLNRGKCPAVLQYVRYMPVLVGSS